jgi:hypothetical protein
MKMEPTQTPPASSGISTPAGASTAAAPPKQALPLCIIASTPTEIPITFSGRSVTARKTPARVPSGCEVEARRSIPHLHGVRFATADEVTAMLAAEKADKEAEKKAADAKAAAEKQKAATSDGGDK